LAVRWNDLNGRYKNESFMPEESQAKPTASVTGEV